MQTDDDKVNSKRKDYRHFIRKKSAQNHGILKRIDK